MKLTKKELKAMAGLNYSRLIDFDMKLFKVIGTYNGKPCIYEVKAHSGKEAKLMVSENVPFRIQHLNASLMQDKNVMPCATLKHK